jgi:putative ABC transport system permease protein
MLKNYFLITIRSFWENRATSIIKIVGLALGLSAVMLIHIFTSFQYSYDDYNKNGSRIYRVAYHLKKMDGMEWDEAKTGHNMASMLQNNFPD